MPVEHDLRNAQAESLVALEFRLRSGPPPQGRTAPCWARASGSPHRKDVLHLRRSAAPFPPRAAPRGEVFQACAPLHTPELCSYYTIPTPAADRQGLIPTRPSRTTSSSRPHLELVLFKARSWAGHPPRGWSRRAEDVALGARRDAQTQVRPHESWTQVPL